jgi:hypothetical protein
VLPTATVVPIFFNNDTDPNASIAQMSAFYTGIGAQQLWTQLSEYGVGPPAPVTPITLNESAPANIDDSLQSSPLEQWLLGEIDAGTVPANIQGSTTYVINYPLGTTITTGCVGGDPASCQPSCQAFGGYHADMQLAPNQNASYIVIPRCPAIPGLTELQTLTLSASHELVEAATDPYPNYDPAWLNVDAAHVYYDEANQGSEIADMCENDPESPISSGASSSFPFVVQRFWSNAAAAAGHDPCVPKFASEIFFNSVPVLPNTASFAYNGLASNSVIGAGPYTVSSLSIPVGHTGTLSVQLYSDQVDASAPWTVTPLDYNQAFGTGNPAFLSFSPASLTGKNGDTLNFTVNVLSSPASGASGPNSVLNTELFILESKQGSGSNALIHLTYGVISN